MPRILLDQSVPRPLRRHLTGDTSTAAEMGWAELENGSLLTAAEAMGFDVFVTCDQNLRHQQNLEPRAIAIVVLGTNRWRVIEQAASSIAETVASIERGRMIVLLQGNTRGDRSVD